MRHRNWTVAVVFCILALISMQTHAIEYNLGVKASVGLDATVGLDQTTRDFISGLPKEVREQVLQLLTDALPLIDKSVETYMKQVDDILNRQIDHLQCSLVGAGTTLGAELKQAVTFGTVKPTPYERLEQDWQATVSGLTLVATPHIYRAAYTDFLYRAQVARCQTQISPETTQDITSLLAKARPKWNLWLRLDGRCSDPEQCLDSQLLETKRRMGAGNALDVSSVNATARFARIAGSNLHRRAPTTSLANYESELNELLSIQDSLATAAAARVNAANELVAAAQSLLANLDQEILVAQKEVHPVDELPCMHVVYYQQINRARPHTNTAASNAADIGKALAQAMALNPDGVRKPTDKLRQELTLRQTTIEDLQNVVPSKIQNPSPCHIEVH